MNGWTGFKDISFQDSEFRDYQPDPDIGYRISDIQIYDLCDERIGGFLNTDAASLANAELGIPGHSCLRLNMESVFMRKYREAESIALPRCSQWFYIEK